MLSKVMLKVIQFSCVCVYVRERGWLRESVCSVTKVENEGLGKD